jgi:hypothetical protein
MNRSERRELRRQKKLFKQRRRKYAAEERASVRRLNKEQKQKISAQKKKYRQARIEKVQIWLSWIFRNPFRKPEKESDTGKTQQIFMEFSGPEEKIRRKPKQNKWNDFLRSSKPAIDPQERQRYKQRRREFRKRRILYQIEERRSIKREHHEMRKELTEMQRRILVARIEGFKKNLIKFLKNPIRKRKIEGAEKLLLSQVKQDIKKQRITRLKQMPSDIRESFLRFWLNRYNQARFIRRNASGFAKLVKAAWKIQALRTGYLQTLINSTVFFILSFLVVYYIFQFVTIYTAQAFNIPSKLFSYRIEWPLYTYSYLYTRVALVVIFGTGPLASLITAFLFYRLFLWSRSKTKYAKLFFIWGSFHSFNLFFGSYIAGVLTRTGFIYTSEWLFISNMFDVEEIIFMVIAIVVLLIIGYFATKQFLYSTSSASLIEPKYRTIFVLSQVVIPWFSGNLILFFSNIPKNPIELILLYLTTILMVLPVVASYNSTSLQQMNLTFVPRKAKTGWIYLFVVVGLVISIRFLLRDGLSFI